jgi:hypothetical protein
MKREWFSRIIQVAVISLAIAAVCQELEKPEEERKWHGIIAGFIPYDFRPPTIKRLKEAYWNPEYSHIFTPEAFGVGWAINFYSLLEKLRLMGQAYASEEDFLMPTKEIKDLLSQQSATD